MDVHIDLGMESVPLCLTVEVSKGACSQLSRAYSSEKIQIDLNFLLLLDVDFLAVDDSGLHFGVGYTYHHWKLVVEDTHMGEGMAVEACKEGYFQYVSAWVFLVENNCPMI